MRRYLTLIIGSLLGLVTSHLSFAADDPANPGTQVVWSEIKVVVTGDDGQPAVRAAVMPYAMRMVEREGHGFWPRDQDGVSKDYFTDDTGTVVIRFPGKIGRDAFLLTTKSVTFQVRHSDYVQQVVDFELGNDLDHPPQQCDVTMQKGCELQVAAVDEFGAQVTQFGVFMAGRYAPDFWADDGNGGRRTSSLKDGTWQTMLVKGQDDGPTLFSALLPLRVRPSQAVKLRNIKLSPGTRISGTLTDNVPRPVKNGFVIACAAPKPFGGSYDETSPSLVWHDWTTVADDGSFELPSMPRSGVVQIIVLCDDWLSTTTMPDAKGFFVEGQLFDVDGEQVEITVAMEQTGTLELTVLKPDGTPLDSGQVSSSPNQLYYKGGSTFLGQRYRTIDKIRNQLRPANQQVPFTREILDLPFTNRPIEHGQAILRGLPIAKSESIHLSHPEFLFPTDVGGGVGRTRFSIESPEPKQMTITVRASK